MLTALGVVLVVGMGGIPAVSSTLGSGAQASGGTTTTRGQVRANSSSSEAVRIRLTARGVRMDITATDDSADCVAHSYGAVQEFLRRHPCLALHRAQLELRDRRGDVALVAAFWVEMADADLAEQLIQLLDEPGTGNIIELSRQRGKYRQVRYSGPAYGSKRDGSVVISAQAEPVARRWAGLALTSVISNVL